MCNRLKLSRRALIAGSIALPLLGAGSPARAQARALPLLPFNSNFTFWEHHWIMWVDHPVYEAIEVSLSQPAADAAPLIRLWLTERAEGNRQVYYFNDETLARGFAQESHFAPIELRHDGAPGQGRNLSIAFADKDGAPVRWEMRFPATARLSRERTGLKPQNGHAARSVLLFWYVNNLRAEGGSGSLEIGGHRSEVDAGARPGFGFQAAYNAGVCSAVIPYGRTEVVPAEGGFRVSAAGGRTFRREGQAYVAPAQALRQSGSIVLECGTDGRTTGYRHSLGDHAFALALDAPLPQAAGEQAGFRMTVDGQRVAGGTVSAAPADGGAVALRWEFTDPDWAREVGVGTLVMPGAAGGYALRVAPLH